LTQALGCCSWVLWVELGKKIGMLEVALLGICVSQLIVTLSLNSITSSVPGV